MEIFVDFFNSGLGNMLKALGIVATFIISLMALLSNKRIMKKGAYIKEITPLRERYIQNLRQHVSEFASLALEFNRLPGVGKTDDPSLKRQLLKELDLKYGQTSLFLNEENDIDKHLANYLQAVRLAATAKGKAHVQIEETIRKMFLFTQQVLLFEWKNLKFEATNGPMSQKEIETKRDEFLEAKRVYFL
jgi:hypothetical protein